MSGKPSLSNPATLLATWFGAGLAPIAPGTVGSAAALPFAVVIAWLAGPPWLLPAAALVFLVGVWAAGAYAKRIGVSDPGPVVIDEVAGQFITLAFVPLDPVLYALGFFLFRAADIFKPFPANWADRTVEGGLGVMLDDVFAAVYSALALWLIHHYVW